MEREKLALMTSLEPLDPAIPELRYPKTFCFHEFIIF
jgi:hypothetical protein